jgi:O-antigen/teichoic acid export membrane protein
VLTPADYGSFDLFMVLAGILNLTLPLEITQGVARYYACEKDKSRKVGFACTAFWFTFGVYATFSLFAFVATEFLSNIVLGQHGLESEFRIGVLYLFCTGLFNVVQNQFKWELRGREYAISAVLVAVCTAVSSTVFAYFLNWGLDGVLLGMFIGQFIGVSFGILRLRTSFPIRFDADRLWEMLRFSTPLVFSGITVWGNIYIDRISIKHLLSVNEVGLYAIGFRLSSLLLLLVAGFQGALTPLIYAHHADKATPVHIEQLFRCFVCFTLIAYLTLALFAEDIIRLVTTGPFHGGSDVVVFLAPAMVLSNLYIFAPGISIAKKTYMFIWINASGAIVNLALNLMLIPILGIIGAALATLIGQLTSFLIHMTVSQFYYKVPHDWPKLVVAVLIIAGFAYFIPQFSLTFGARIQLSIAAIISAGSLMLVLGLVRIEEIRQVFSHRKASQCDSVH